MNRELALVIHIVPVHCVRYGNPASSEAALSPRHGRILCGMGSNLAGLDRGYDGGALSKAARLDRRLDATAEQVDLIMKKGMVAHDQVQGYRSPAIFYTGLRIEHRNLDPGNPLRVSAYRTGRCVDGLPLQHVH